MKKKKLISGLIIATTLFSSSLVALAATSSDGIATGGFQASIVGSQTKNTAYTSTASSIQNYAEAKFRGYSSYDKKSSVNYGYSSVTAYAPKNAYLNAFGGHSYMYGGPRQFYSY